MQIIIYYLKALYSHENIYYTSQEWILKLSIEFVT